MRELSHSVLDHTRGHVLGSIPSVQSRGKSHVRRDPQQSVYVLSQPSRIYRTVGPLLYVDEPSVKARNCLGMWLLKVLSSGIEERIIGW